MTNNIIFENENARLLFMAVAEYYPNFYTSEDEELTEESALKMYYSVNQRVVAF